MLPAYNKKVPIRRWPVEQSIRTTLLGERYELRRELAHYVAVKCYKVQLTLRCVVVVLTYDWAIVFQGADCCSLS